MKNKLRLIVFILCIWSGAASARDLKVLMIGNSFSNSVGTFLPSLVRAYPEHSLELTNAFIGGCPLDKHVRNIKLAQKNPKRGLYKITVWNSSKKDAPEIYSGNLVDLLKKQTYDIITIQQGSAKSWDWKSYEPYAGELISFIRECQPNAEIVVHQTWSYRVDAPRYEVFKFGQTKMYDLLRDAYGKLAERYKLRVIPMGDSVQLFRKYTPVKFEPSPGTFEYPKVPSSRGDVVGSARWVKPRAKGKDKARAEKNGQKARKLQIDRIHLNSDGRYLQACVWFSVLYDEPADKITWVPEGMPQDFAALLRKCAVEAVESYVQVTGKKEKK